MQGQQQQGRAGHSAHQPSQSARHASHRGVESRSVRAERIFRKPLMAGRHWQDVAHAITVSFDSEQEADVFVQLVSFLYSGRMGRRACAELLDLLLVADRFDMQPCVTLFSDVLSKRRIPYELALRIAWQLPDCLGDEEPGSCSAVVERSFDCLAEIYGVSSRGPRAPISPRLTRISRFRGCERSCGACLRE
jgi:hypothetical protein